MGSKKYLLKRSFNFEWTVKLFVNFKKTVLILNGQYNLLKNSFNFVKNSKIIC